MTKKYASLQLHIGTVEQDENDPTPRVCVDLPETDEEILIFVKNIRKQLEGIGRCVTEGIPMGGDRSNPYPITSLGKNVGDLMHVFATYSQERIQMTDVRNDPIEEMETAGLLKRQ